MKASSSSSSSSSSLLRLSSSPLPPSPSSYRTSDKDRQIILTSSVLLLPLCGIGVYVVGGGVVDPPLLLLYQVERELHNEEHSCSNSLTITQLVLALLRLWSVQDTHRQREERETGKQNIAQYRMVSVSVCVSVCVCV